MIIIVVNSRFVPTDRGQPYLYGVVQHVAAASSALASLGRAVRFLLYLRDESISVPKVENSAAFGLTAVTMRFNYRMDGEQVAGAMESCIGHLLGSFPRSSAALYLQTPTVAQYLPGDIPWLLTNHGPFVHDVAARIGVVSARAAFDWDHDKYDSLRTSQIAGMTALKQSSNGLCLEISKIQVKAALGLGMSPDRVIRLAPPIDNASRARDRDLDTLAQSRAILRLPAGHRVAVTTVARLDHFKRIELFVQGAALAISRGAVDGMVVIGGERTDPARQRLRDSLPNDIRDRSVFLPRQRHEYLVNWLFPWCSDHGIFACTSRFDLVPYTVLEVARAGGWVLCPNSPNVGACEYLDPKQLFEETPEGLCSSLAWACSHPAAPILFDACSRRIASASGSDKMAEQLLDCLAQIAASRT